MVGLEAAQENDITIAVSTELNDDLINEGLVRDLIRQVQLMRKNADFAVEDRIEVFGKFDGKLQVALDQFKDYFCNETLTIGINTKNDNIEYSEDIKIQKERIKLGISRVKKD
jgi:isoleucyl-tRNA synthetase